jgi:hypothetical protein
VTIVLQGSTKEQQDKQFVRSVELVNMAQRQPRPLRQAHVYSAQKVAGRLTKESALNVLVFAVPVAFLMKQGFREIWIAKIVLLDGARMD